ncbi:MAG: YlxR family protein [Lachnospiraceae bacterium]|nr:YlxR family protein [Lachnospiraceae bacterium]
MAVQKKIPMRQCVGCRESKSKKEMIRVIRTPEGTFTIDATGRRNGRGAYICPISDCLKKAVKNHGLERSFSCPIPPEVYSQLEEEMKIVESE